MRLTLRPPLRNRIFATAFAAATILLIPVCHSAAQTPATDSRAASIAETLSSYQSGYTSIFSTSGHAKANGLSIRLALPQSWSGREGIRPHILQLFAGSTLDGRIMECTVGVFAIPEEISFLSDEDLSAVLFDPEIASGSLPEGTTAFLVEATRYDGEPGVIMGYTLEAARAGVQISTLTFRHWFLYNRSTVDVQVTLVLSTVGTKPPPNETEVRLFTLLAIMIGNSLVIDDKWK